MRIVVSSDFHGHLPEITEEFDLFLICGDICPAHDHYFSFQIDWFLNEFCEWVDSLPFKDENSKVVMTWGNHDFVGESIKKAAIKNISKLTNGRLIILKNEEYEFQGLKIFGTPYCKEFFNWAFMLSTKKLARKYDKIPDGVDILISHDSPMIGEYGMIHEGWHTGEDAGNPVLAEFIISKKPKMAFFGHIHSHDHRFMKVGDTWMAGVSYINEEYRPAYLPLELDYIDGEIHIPELKIDGDI